MQGRKQPSLCHDAGCTRGCSSAFGRVRSRLSLDKVQDVEVAADTDYARLAGLLEGFSGDDCTSVCRDAAMNGLRRKIAGKTPEEIRCAPAQCGMAEPLGLQAALRKQSGTCRRVYVAWSACCYSAANDVQGDEPPRGPGPRDHGRLHAGLPASPAYSVDAIADEM